MKSSSLQTPQNTTVDDLASYLKRHSKKFLIFDFDETICHLHLPWHILVEDLGKLFEELDGQMFDELAKEYSIPKMDNFYVKKYGAVVKAKILDYCQRFETEQLEGASENKALTSWLGTFLKQQADENYQFFVWSSNCTDTVEPILRQVGVLDLFSLVVTQDKVTLLKPEPEGFGLIEDWLKQNGHVSTSKEDFLMIGNSLYADKGAADQAGIDYFYHAFSVK